MKSENNINKVTALRSIRWTGLEIFFKQGLQLFVSIILARLLGPDDFGIIATIYIFTSIASAFIDGGLSTALIQNQNITSTDESTVFWFNLCVGALMSLLLWSASELIAGFYGLPILIGLAKILAVNIFISSLGAIHNTLLIKHFKSKILMVIGVSSAVTSGCVGVIMAWQGYGVWALAIQTISGTALSTILLWALSSWRPKFVFSLLSAKKLFSFGSYMMASTVLDNLYGRFCSVLIAKIYGVRELGLYNRAESTSGLSSQFLSPIISRVALPVFSAYINNPLELRTRMQEALRTAMLLNLPAMLGMAAVAEPLIHVMFGEKWLPATAATQILCLAGVLWPLHLLNLNALMAQGHSKLFFGLDVAKKIVGISLLLFGSKYGVLGIAWSLLVSGVIAYFMNTFYTKKYIGYGLFSQIIDLLPILGISLLMYSVVHLADNYLQINVSIKLVVLVLLGFSGYLLLAHLFNIVTARQVYNLISSKNESNA